MAEETNTPDGAEAPEKPQAAPAVLHVAPGPHIAGMSLTTRRMMIDVLIALAPVLFVAAYVFRWYVAVQVGLCLLSCILAETMFSLWRHRAPTLGDCSAAVTGVILGLSLPWSAPPYVPVVASFAAVGLGKMVFGGVGQNVFNPAMVGRAFVMICFANVMGASAYVTGEPSGAVDVITRATPLTAAKQLAQGPSLVFWPMFVGYTNGSLGETSALACLMGGLYLCFRRTASWEIPAGVVATAAILAGIAHLVSPQTQLSVLHHLAGGSLLFGAFYIATDPVSSPLTRRGKLAFGAGLGAVVMLIRIFSGYPEGVMFAVLLMNALVPLINRWTVPRPVGGAVPVQG